MAIYRHNPSRRMAAAARTSGVEQHLLSVFVLAVAAVTVLLTLAS